jgi:hypothetical protein
MSDRYVTAAMPSEPQISPTSVVIPTVRAAKPRCSSGVKVKPHGLRPRVLYLSNTDTLSLRTKKGVSYRTLFTLPALATR